MIMDLFEKLSSSWHHVYENILTNILRQFSLKKRKKDIYTHPNQSHPKYIISYSLLFNINRITASFIVRYNKESCARLFHVPKDQHFFCALYSKGKAGQFSWFTGSTSFHSPGKRVKEKFPLKYIRVKFIVNNESLHQTASLPIKSPRLPSLLNPFNRSSPHIRRQIREIKAQALWNFSLSRQQPHVRLHLYTASRAFHASPVRKSRELPHKPQAKCVERPLADFIIAAPFIGRRSIASQPTTRYYMPASAEPAMWQ